MKDLQETVDLMLSGKWEDRLIAEYWQTKIRYEKLHKITIMYEAGTLYFEPKCPLCVLISQKKNMGEYLHILEIRAAKEGIDLDV